MYDHETALSSDEVIPSLGIVPVYGHIVQVHP